MSLRQSDAINEPVHTDIGTLILFISMIVPHPVLLRGFTPGANTGKACGAARERPRTTVRLTAGRLRPRCQQSDCADARCGFYRSLTAGGPGVPACHRPPPRFGNGQRRWETEPNKTGRDCKGQISNGNTKNTSRQCSVMFVKARVGGGELEKCGRATTVAQGATAPTPAPRAPLWGSP